uniref:RRP7 domain-containing protein n=1 Tax=Haemonchus contortus TaxID=6289 RepID=A0A7I4YAE4_HAECO
MEVDNADTSFRKVMNQVRERERDRAPFAELTPFNLAEAERKSTLGRKEGSQEDPLHLFHLCTCNIFRTKAQTTLSSLVVEELREPARGFDARVVDAYRTIDTTVPWGHPATSPGISPRRDDDRFYSRQRAVFLKQVRKFAMRTLSQPIFFPVERDKRDDAADTNASSTKPKDEPLKKKPKIVKPHVMYVRDAKAEHKRHEHLMKQKKDNKVNVSCRRLASPQRGV